MKKSTIVVVVLAILVLISMVQAFQLNGLKTKVSEGQLSTGSASSPVSTASSGSPGRAAALPASVTDLPQMVGGC